MNKRERFLIFMLLGLLIVVGGWALFYFSYQKPKSALDSRMASVQGDIKTMTQELDNSNAQIAAIFKRNPHLRNFPKLSLPEAKLAPGKVKTPDEATRHVAQVQGEYESYLSELVRASGFSATSINVTPRQPDSKSSPVLPGKGPIYTKVSFVVSCNGNLASIVSFMCAFYTENLLHEIHQITINKPGTIRQGTQPDALEVQMTIEALLVSGAEARDELKPKIDDKLQVSVLNQEKRHYDEMLTKNIFLGKVLPGQEGTLREDPNQVLAFVKLTTVSWNGRRWEAYMYDQGKPGLYPARDESGGVFAPDSEKQPAPPREQYFLNLAGKMEFSIYDRYENFILSAKTLLIDDHMIVINVVKVDDRLVIAEKDQFGRVGKPVDVKGKCFELQTGDFFGPALLKPLSNTEIKLLGLTPPVEKAETHKPSDEKSGSDKTKAKDPMSTPE